MMRNNGRPGIMRMIDDFCLTTAGLLSKFSRETGIDEDC
jgi:hypothetical protein